MVLALIPGWGHIYLGKEFQGLVLFTLTAASGFAWLNSLWIYLGAHQPAVFFTAGFFTMAFCLYSLVSVFRATAPWRLERLERQRNQLLWEGMLGFLRSEYQAAEEKFIEGARLDPLDPEPLWRAGIVAARSGSPNAARRLLLKARRLDLEGKWRWEIEQELVGLEKERIKAGSSRPGAPASPANQVAERV